MSPSKGTRADDARGTSAESQAGAPGEPADALARALEDLRREIRVRLPRPPSPPVVRGGSSGEWMALFEGIQRRARTFGMTDRDGEVDDFGLDPGRLRRLRPLLEWLRQRWWRVDVHGLDAVPDAPVLFVANHSGLLPWDGLMIAHVVADARSEAARPRFLVADWLVTRPFAAPALARLGGVRACRENAERLIRSGRSVVAFPEGLKGAGKVFRERYRLQRFGRGGVVRVALATGAPLVPVAVVGAEETYPVLFKVGRLVRSLGLPFLPVTPTFPWLGPLGAVPLPSKWTLRFGAPLDATALGPEAAEDELLVSRLTEELRGRIQSMVDADLHARAGVFR